MIRAAGVLSLVLALAVPAPAAELPVVRERLPNGMTVLVRDNPSAPVVALSLLVRMGGAWETADNPGISNFLQAVMVKGTTRRSGGELAETLATLGGKLSASGEVDYSEIRASALARFWPQLLALTAELALEPALAPDEMEREREFVLARIKKREDNPSARAFDTFFAAVYGAGHPYGLPTLGTSSSIQRIRHPALVDWYRSFYRPERIVLAISGQVPPAQVLVEVKRLFGGMAGGDAAADSQLPAPMPAGGRTVVEQPAQQTQILVGGLAPAAGDRDYAAVKVLATVLGGGMAGRLFTELRDKQALAYSAAAFYDPQKGPGALILQLGTAPENAGRAEQALAAEVARIRTRTVAAEELARAKAYLLGTFAIDRRTNARQAWYLAFFELLGLGYDFPIRYRAAVEAVTEAEVLRVAQKYLATPASVILRPPERR